MLRFLLPLAIFIAAFSNTYAWKKFKSIESALFIGNSFTYYNGGLEKALQGLYDAAEAPFKAVKKTTGGKNLKFHFQDKSKISEIEKGTYDIVILQGFSNEAYEDSKIQGFKTYGAKLDSVVRASGSRSALFMTWSYQDKINMVDKIASNYEDLGKDLDLPVIPAGKAFKAIDLEQGTDYLRSDYRHPSPAGTYLAACTFYSSFTGQSPVGNSYKPNSLTEAEARKLQETAWNTVIENGPWLVKEPSTQLAGLGQAPSFAFRNNHSLEQLISKGNAKSLNSPTQNGALTVHVINNGCVANLLGKSLAK